MLSIISVIWHLLYISFYKFIDRNQIRAQADSVAHHFCAVVIILVIWHFLYISSYKFIERNQIRAQADSVAQAGSVRYWFILLDIDGYC
jgi:hypothetical protein